MSIKTIASRLKSTMQEKGLSSTELARLSDVKATFLYDILNGKSNNPSMIKLAKVCDTLGINLYYLLGKEDHHETALPESAPLNSEFIAIRQLKLDNVLNDLSSGQAEKYTGPNYFRRSWIEERLRASPDNLRMLHVSGDDMQPTLHSGDMVLIDISKKNPTPPGLFAIYDGMGYVVKRLEYISQSIPPRVTVLSDNKNYTTFDRTLSDIHIIGRVVWFAREM